MSTPEQPKIPSQKEQHAHMAGQLGAALVAMLLWHEGFQKHRDALGQAVKRLPGRRS